MKALFYTGTQQIELRETDEPTVGDGECLVEVSHCGICGSDMHAYHGHDARRVPPMILGHEAVGTARTGIHAGKRVAINPLVSCGKCVDCENDREHLCASRDLLGMKRPGAFAELVAAPEQNCVVLPDTLSFELAALSEPLACAVHAVNLAMDHCEMPAQEMSVSVLGGGAIGLLCALVFAHRGVGKLAIAEPNELRRSELSKATSASPYDPISGSCPLEVVDVVLDAVGTGVTRAAASALVRPGGNIVHIGLQDSNDGLDTRRMTLQEIGFVGTYCYRPDEFKHAVKLLANGLINDPAWIDHRPLSAGASGFSDIHDGKAAPKIILACR